MAELPARERIILAIDTSSKTEAERLAVLAKEAGARFVKLGLELETATSWSYCSELAGCYGLDWIADAKLDDIGNTVEKAAINIAEKSHPPFGITMHAKASNEAKRKAQAAVDPLIVFGVTELTDIPPEETVARYGLLREELVMRLASDVANTKLKGVVASPKEISSIKSNEKTRGLFTMIPGTRSVGANSHDQENVDTPANAIKNGADLLVIGRQITQAEDPAQAYEALVNEIEGAI